MSYEIVQVGVHGVGQGLLMHNPAGMVRPSDEGGPARSGKKIPKSHDEAVSALYILPGGTQLYASADWFREAMLMAAKEFKDTTRRGNATMVQRVSASVFQSELYFPLFRITSGAEITSDDKDWAEYLKRVVVQGNGIVRSRPLITDWQCTVQFEYDDEAVAPAMIAPILHTAGKFPGVGDYRPGKKGPFGRFMVVSLNGEPWAPEVKKA